MNISVVYFYFAVLGIKTGPHLVCKYFIHYLNSLYLKSCRVYGGSSVWCTASVKVQVQCCVGSYCSVSVHHRGDIIKNTNGTLDGMGQQGYTDRCKQVCKASAAIIQRAVSMILFFFFRIHLFLRWHLIVQTGLKMVYIEKTLKIWSCFLPPKCLELPASVMLLFLD